MSSLMLIKTVCPTIGELSVYAIVSAHVFLNGSKCALASNVLRA
jgi:hypothetical protein